MTGVQTCALPISYDPANIPGFTDPNRREFQVYKDMPAPKAMVIRAFGFKVATATGADEVDAQIKALAACNDPDPVLPCFVYAINDRVVFSQRRPEPIR